MVVALIRLTLAVRRHTPAARRTGGLALGVLAAALTWAATLAAAPGARPDVLGLLLAGWFVGWVIGPFSTTAAPAVRPEQLALLPLDRRRLGAGLLASAFVGVGTVVTLVGVSTLVGYGVATAPGGGTAAFAAAVALAAVPLFTVGAVATSRALSAVLGTAMRTRVGVEIAGLQYGLLLALLFAGLLLIAPTVSATPVFLDEGFGGAPASGVLAALPSAWPVHAVDAAAAGDAAAALGWLAAVAGFAGLVVVAAIRLLTPQVDRRASRRRPGPRRGPLHAAVRLLPAGRLGAVTAKELRTWWRDPWRSLEVRSAIWFGVFVGVFALVAGRPDVAGLSGVAVALTVALSGANLYGQDGTALWQLVVAESPAAVRADVHGRQVGLVLALGLPAVLLTAVTLLLTGATTYAVPILGVLIAAVGAGSGIAVLVSLVGLTPGVDPQHRVNATDVGENGYAIQVATWGTAVLVLPTVLAAAGPVLDGRAATGREAAVVLAVAVGNGLLAAVVLGSVAARRLQAHLTETFARVRYPGLTPGTTSDATT